MTPLRQRMIDELTLRGMAARTHESYLEAVSGLAKYYHRSPEQLSIEEVRAYLLHLERDRHLSWNSLNVAVSGLRFLYFKTLKWELTRMDIPPRRKASRLPEVLSREEVDRLLAAADNPKHRMTLMTLYAAGLRLNEATHLRVHDIDSSRMTIRVEQGKGRKDRYTVLSPRLLEELRVYWKQHPSRQYLFFGTSPDQPLHETAIQKAYNRASSAPGFRRETASTRCATVSPRTCWRPGPMSAPFKCCSGIPIYRPRRGTCRSVSTRYTPMPASSTCWRFLGRHPAIRSWTPRPSGPRQHHGPGGNSPTCSGFTATPTDAPINCRPLI